jgi:hypothetical protein
LRLEFGGGGGCELCNKKQTEIPKKSKKTFQPGTRRHQERRKELAKNQKGKSVRN